MKVNLTILIFLITINAVGQNDSGLKNYGVDKYDWEQLKQVTIINDDNTKYDADEIMIADLENKAKQVVCGNIQKWKLAFATLSLGPNKDIRNEKTYILLCEFQGGQKIPFRYFLEQYAIYDMRKGFHYFYAFPEFNKRMKIVASECIHSLENLR